MPSINRYKARVKKLEAQVKELRRQLLDKTRVWKKSQAESAALIEELRQRAEELEKFERFTIGRELKMVELKNRIKELEAKSR